MTLVNSTEYARPTQLSWESPGQHQVSAAPIPQNRVKWWTFLLIIWLLGGFYAAAYLKRGWVPHDEGAFAESADRVLHGELPHRDYIEIYTGGLAYLHSFAFRYLGESFATPRIVLFAIFLAWIPVFYWIAGRFVSDWIAAGVTLLAIAWSLPNYSAAVPSWYNLFFATFGLAALFRYLEVRSGKWLFLAGLCGGFSILAKIAGLYYILAALLFFLFAEQSEAASQTNQAKRRSFVYTSGVVLSMFLLVAGIAALIRPRASLEVDLDFVIPSAALAAILLFREQHCRRSSSRERFGVFLRMSVPFGAGTLLPVLTFLIPYVRGSGVHALVNGLFVLPYKRLQGAYLDPPELATIIPTLCLIVLFALGGWLRGRARWFLCAAAGVVAIYFLVSSRHNMHVYRIPWHAAYWLIPGITLAGSFLLWQTERAGQRLANSRKRQQLFLVLSVTALCALVQYPFAAPIYFCYVAPLVILGVVALLSIFPAIPKALLAIMFAEFFLFAVFRVTPPFINSMDCCYQPDQQTQVLDLSRAGNLRVDSQSVSTYRRLISVIQQHAGGGEIYASPDCPQVYFLAGYRNPTRAMFNLFDDENGAGENVLKLLDSRNITVVVLNTAPQFSPVVTSSVHSSLAERFPREERIGDFEVRWRE